MIDISSIQYDVELVIEDGTRYLLNAALISQLQWEEQLNELAQRATLTVANAQIGDSDIIEKAKINCFILIYGKWGEGDKTLLFEGAIWEWQYTSAANQELTITAYDHMIRLQGSKTFKYYSAGMTTQAIIGDVCDELGIPLAYKWGESITHEKKIYSGTVISDIIIELLEEVHKKTKKEYIIYYRDSQVQIVDYGSNGTVYLFDTLNTISTHNKLTMNDLVTRVKIIGKQNNDERAPVDETVDGETRFGIFQEIVRRDENKTLDAIKAEAETIIKDHGKPDELIQLTVPDLPFLRKGDKIDVSAGNLMGFFYVEGVSHFATARQMSLTLSRVENG